MSNIKKKAKTGVIWSAVEKFSVQGVQFVISIMLARLLVPQDFGLIALILVLLNILQTINEVGFGAALMYKQDRDDLDFSSVFILNIFLGTFLYGLLYFIAPSLADFFNQPQLTSLTRMIGLTLILNSFIVVQRTILLIKVDFKTQAKASLIAVIISGVVGIIMAIYGYGVIALVYQAIVNSLISVVLIWQLVKWRPSWIFSYIRILFLFKFAYKLILARLINTVFDQFYSLVIGKVYSPAQLGFFNRAQSFIAISSNNIVSIVQRVSTPLLCEVQNDYKQMGNMLNKFISTTALIVFPLLCGLFVLTEPFVSIILTDKWLSTVPMLQLLCPVGMLYVISTFNRNIYNATGRTDWALKTEIIKKTLFVVIVLIALKFSFYILLLSQILIGLIELLVDTYYTKKQIGITLLHQLNALKGIFLASLFMGLSIFCTIYFINNNLLKLIIGCSIGLTVYPSLCYLYNIAGSRAYFKTLLIMIKK